MDAIVEISTHPWLGRLWARLTVPERNQLLGWLSNHDHLDRGAFEAAVSRMWLDAATKPRHAREMQELLSCANTAAHTE